MKTDKLLKKYPEGYKKIRRVWVNLFRHKKGVDPMALIMTVLFVIAVLTSTFFPFIAGWVFVAISFIYFKIFPLSWEEMNEYEKVEYRKIFKLPESWNP